MKIPVYKNKKNYQYRCFACDKPMRVEQYLIDTRDGQTAYVGPCCFRKIKKEGEQG